jgi:hypothetical protein
VLYAIFGKFTSDSLCSNAKKGKKRFEKITKKLCEERSGVIREVKAMHETTAFGSRGKIQ